VTNDRHRIVADLGTDIGPETMMASFALDEEELKQVSAAYPVSHKDVPYGEHERHRLDIYGEPGTEAKPILVWVHGGGFMRGDKEAPNAYIGSAAAQQGYLGVVINYRLAPDNPWPAGPEDLDAAIGWLKGNAASFGGDPDRISIMGSSAGAVHVAGYLKHRPDHKNQIRAAIMLSGLFGVTGVQDIRDRSYYGEDESAYAAMLPLDAVVETDLPIHLACAEFDPERFQIEFVEVLQRRLARHRTLPSSYIASGHNHYTLGSHLGASDTRLRDELFAFLARALA